MQCNQSKCSLISRPWICHRMKFSNIKNEIYERFLVCLSMYLRGLRQNYFQKTFVVSWFQCKTSIKIGKLGGSNCNLILWILKYWTTIFLPPLELFTYWQNSSILYHVDIRISTLIYSRITFQFDVFYSVSLSLWIMTSIVVWVDFSKFTIEDKFFTQFQAFDLTV